MIIEFELLTLLSILNLIWNSLCGKVVKCGDCADTQFGCPMVEYSGMYCENITDLAKIKLKGKNSKKNPKKGKFADCVPDDREVIGDIWDWCCFWNPQIGCQQLRGLNYEHSFQSNEEETCEICLQSCQCHPSNRESRNGPARVLVLCFNIIRIYLFYLRG